MGDKIAATVKARVDDDAGLKLADPFDRDALIAVGNRRFPIKPQKIDLTVTCEQLLHLSLHRCRIGSLMQREFRVRSLQVSRLPIRTEGREFGIQSRFLRDVCSWVSRKFFARLSQFPRRGGSIERVDLLTLSEVA